MKSLDKDFFNNIKLTYLVHGIFLLQVSFREIFLVRE